MKTKEELKALKEEYENMSKKLTELSEDELRLITGGTHDTIYIHGLETIGPYADAAHKDMPASHLDSYSDGFTVDEGAGSIEEIIK